MAEEKPIIVIKKKGGHGGHHGGAWKVAYADFVTAMMCFFMVMWLINTADTNTKKNIAQYFKKPGIFDNGSGAPLLIGGSGMLEEESAPHKRRTKKYAVGDSQVPLKRRSGTEDAQLDKDLTEFGEPAKGVMQGSEDTKGYGVKEADSDAKETHSPAKLDTQASSSSEASSDEAAALQAGGAGEPGKTIEQAAADLRAAIAASPELQELIGEVDVKIGADGLHIEIMDTEKTSMFESGSASINSEAQAAFKKLADILAKLPNTIDIVGHTDARPFRGRSNYSNWELSADRANAARRLLEDSGIPAARITNVLGRADREPKVPSDPNAAANRRITLTLKFPMQHLAEVPKTLDALRREPQIALGPPPDLKRPSGLDLKPADEPDKVHSFTTKDILKQGTKRQWTVHLPEEAHPDQNPTYIEKDKIFGDSPVLGPPRFGTP